MTRLLPAEFSLSHLLVGILPAFLLFCSCSASKNVVYLGDVQSGFRQEIDRPFEMRIQPDDMLAITVNSKDPELAAPFNMPLISMQMGATIQGSSRILGYSVNGNGTIDFPFLGAIGVMGMTRFELADYLKERLVSEKLLQDPIITVQFLNVKISVLGEVARPGSFSVDSDRISLLDALGLAGDLTVYGRRDRVAVIRENNGERIIEYHDLRSPAIFESPYFYLRQNDIVYVEPNKYRAGQSRINQNNSAGVWMSGVSILAALVSIIVNISK